MDRLSTDSRTILPGGRPWNDKGIAMQETDLPREAVDSASVCSTRTDPVGSIRIASPRLEMANRILHAGDALSSMSPRALTIFKGELNGDLDNDPLRSADQERDRQPARVWQTTMQ